MKINNLVNRTLHTIGSTRKTLTKVTLISITCTFVLGCAQQPSYVLALSSKQIKQVQILDLNAAERNDGIIADLDGNYGKNLIRKYQRSIYDMKASRQMTQSSQ